MEKRALHMARIATGDTDEALDVVQDAMMKLVQHYADRSEAEWPPLFYRVLNNRINDWHRRGAVRRRWMAWRRAPEEGDDHPELDWHDPEAPGTERRVAGERAAEALERALRRLPPRQQQAFMLRTWEGLDVAQTAQAMGCSAGSVKTHYSRAVHTLREQLQDHWP